MNLHLGCGPIGLPDWINIDREEFWKPDVAMDYLQLSDRFEEGSASLVFACHTIEHLEYPAGVIRALVQILRVLKPGGVLRIVVPDLLLVAQKYVRGEDLKDIYNFNAFVHKDCPAERFTYFARGWSHTVLFDEQLLGEMMRDAGFVNVRRCAFGQSDTPALRGHDRFQTESMSMEGTKP